MKYFTLDELTFSSTAARKNINNDPPDLAIQSNLKRLVALVLDPLREEIGVPLLVSSGYRCEELNTLIGGAKRSQHMRGLAADVISHRISVKELWETACRMSEADEIWVDQCILERAGNKTWLHISTAEKRRKMYFSITK